MKTRCLKFIVAVFISIAAWHQVSGQSLDIGLVAHYNLDGNGLDSSGNGINGTLMNGATGAMDRFGSPNGAVYFGTNGGDVEGTGLNLANTSSSISLWIDKYYVGNGSNGGWFLRVGDQSVAGGAMHLATDYGQSIRYSFFFDDFDINSPVLVANEWYNLVFTYDDTTNERQIYVDGSMVATNTASYGFSGDSNWAFGFQNIALDDVRFYNRALTPAEVTQLQSAPEPSTCMLLSGILLVCLFRGRKLYTRSAKRIFGCLLSAVAFVFCSVPGLRAETISFDTSTAVGWTAIAAGTSAQPYVVSYQESIGGNSPQYYNFLSVTSDGFSDGQYLPGGNISDFTGFWVAEYSFVLPANSVEVTFNYSNFFADDRAVLELNGQILNGTGIYSNQGGGSMVFSDGGSPVSYSGF